MSVDAALHVHSDLSRGRHQVGGFKCDHDTEEKLHLKDTRFNVDIASHKGIFQFADRGRRDPSKIFSLVDSFHLQQQLFAFLRVQIKLDVYSLGVTSWVLIPIIHNL